MFKLFLFSLLISVCVVASSKEDSVVKNTELLMTFLVHRHGDRTPTASTVTYGTDVEALEALSAKYGYGQLTDNGKKRAYLLGQFIRSRYDELLSPYYNKSEIYIRSTDSTRTKMTVLTAMSAVYPTNEDNWSSEINWTPVPYTTVSAKYDTNLAFVNCPNYLTSMYSLMASSSSAMDEFSDLLKTWSEISGYDMTSSPSMPLTLYDVYLAQRSLGLPVCDEIEELLPEMDKAAAAAWNIIYGNEDNFAFQSGVLLEQFFTVADQVIAGDDVARVQILSAHDANVFGFAAATKITPHLEVVKYGGMYVIELRRTSDGTVIVVPGYLGIPNENVFKYLQMDGCDGYCDLESFRNLTSAYVVDEDTWRTNCGWTADYDIDTSSID